MQLRFLAFSIIVFTTLARAKGSRSLTKIHSHSKFVTIGNTFKMQCPVNTNNIHIIKCYKDGEEVCRFYCGKNETCLLNHSTKKLKTEKSIEKKILCNKRGRDSERFNITINGNNKCLILMEVAKKWRVRKRSTSVLVNPTKGPIISGIKSSYEEGEIIQANCTAAPSNPPPSLVWYINGVPAYGWSMFGYPCQMTGEKLCVLKLGLRIIATRKIFPNRIASFVCEAGILALPPRRAYVTSTLVGVNSAGSIHLTYRGLLGAILWQRFLLY